MNKKQLTEVEKAWLACAIDAEGSIIFNPDKRDKRNHLTRVVVVYNTDKSFIEHFANLVGGHIYIYDPNKIGKGHFGAKPRYEVYISGKNKILNLLTQIKPYLIIKKEKAQQVIDSIIQEQKDISKLKSQKLSRSARMKFLNQILPRDSYGHNRSIKKGMEGK